MKPTKSARTNFRRLSPFLLAADAAGGYRKFRSGAFMPLTVESLGYTWHGLPVYAIAHYGEQNGDLMADPDMEIAADFAAGTIEPLTYQDDYMGRFDRVYCSQDGRELYSPRLRSSLDDFLRLWSSNIIDQGFTADEPDGDAIPA